MIRRPPRSTPKPSSAASDVYKRQLLQCFDLNFRKQAYFVDLFVRVSNKVAVDMYKRLGYSVYRRVLDYYSGDPDEDAFGKFKFI